MKKTIRWLIVVSALTISSSTYAYVYGSIAIDLDGRPLLITMSIVTPLDIFVTELLIRGTFYKRSPTTYDIRTLWRVAYTWWPGVYIELWFHLNAATNFGRHCVEGTHKFYYFDWFGSANHHSGPDCIEIY